MGLKNTAPSGGLTTALFGDAKQQTPYKGFFFAYNLLWW
tara:strand:+ start:431 stop:547 length:117 start_codon:yes stop_codon:yes gene_type:complete